MPVDKPRKPNACRVCGRALKDPVSRQLGIGPVCRLKGAAVAVPAPSGHSRRTAARGRKPQAIQQSLSTWKVEADELPVADIDISEYPYRGHGGCSSVCGLRIWFRERYTIAIATELPGNPGTSVTNAAESLWRKVEDDYNLFMVSPRVLRIEHYPAEPDARDEGSRAHRYDRVIFTSPVRSQGAGVSWEPFGAASVMAAINTPAATPTTEAHR